MNIYIWSAQNLDFSELYSIDLNLTIIYYLVQVYISCDQANYGRMWNY